MISPLTATLWITMIGMGLVFIAILLLWGLMEALMRLSARFAGGDKQRAGEERDEAVEPVEQPALAPDGDLKKRAAAAAVAIALAISTGGRQAVPAQSTGSAWQVVNRARQMSQSTHIIRKS